MQPIILERDHETSSLALGTLMPAIHQQFLTPNPWIYFGDLTISAIVSDVCLVLASNQPAFSLTQAVYIIVAALALFRSLAFMHESYHVGKRLRGLRPYYNFVVGFLHKLPLYSYATHRYHHLPNTYGTLNDPEYETLGDKSHVYNLVFAPFVLMAILPVFLMLRWGILPLFLPFIGQKGRDWVYVNATTLVMNAKFKRPLPGAAERRMWYFEDTMCLLYTLGCALLIYLRILPLTIVPVWFLTFYLVSVMNYYRAMLNHRYFTGFESTNHKQQVLDSVTIPFSWLTGWLYPVGLGYHALHHMFPQIPYHQMGKAHRWLMQTLPEDHPYRRTVAKHYFAAVRELLVRRF